MLFRSGAGGVGQGCGESGGRVAVAAEQRAVEEAHGVVYRVEQQDQKGVGVGGDAGVGAGGNEENVRKFWGIISHRGTEFTEAERLMERMKDGWR